MADPELPTTKSARVDWVIRAPDNAEMRRRYDLWAAAYDDDVGAVDDYLAPLATARAAAGLLPRSAHILDAGAGTGLLGMALRQQGFVDLTAADYSPAMLDIARGKAIYQDLRVADMTRPTSFAAQSFDAIVTAGITTQMPPVALQEFHRLLRPGGTLIFAVIPDAWESCGWAAVLAGLEGRLALVEKGAPFQMMPTTEPDFYCEIWVLRAA